MKRFNYCSRSLRLKKIYPESYKNKDIEALRPCPEDAILLQKLIIY